MATFSPRLGASSSGRLLTVILLVLALAACGGDSADAGDEDASAPELVGSLCEVLPQAGEPGGPEVLATMRADEALTWIPVVTYFEAAARATGMDAELADAEAVTILVPTDDAMLLALNQSTYDELIISRQDELRRLLEAHIVDGRHSLEELEAAGTVTTIGGDTHDVWVEGELPVFGPTAETVCGGYSTANATIHVIGGVLGDLPELAEDEDVH